MSSFSELSAGSATDGIQAAIKPKMAGFQAIFAWRTAGLWTKPLHAITRCVFFRNGRNGRLCDQSASIEMTADTRYRTVAVALN